MKKLISLLIAFATVFSLCACSGDVTDTTATGSVTEASTEATEPAVQTPAIGQTLTPEQMYGHINQLEPVDGVYQIWSDVGVQNMASHPEASFKLLCNVDMGGATVKPIGTAEKPFIGQIDGANFTISNFTVQGGEEADFGFVGVNQGTIQKLLLDKAAFAPGSNAKNIGALVGRNEGMISRCTVSGTMEVTAAAEEANCGAAAGMSTGTVSNTITVVDIAFTASGAATVGGIVGVTDSGVVEYSEANGKLDMTGTNKIAGLLAGVAKNTEIKNCVFAGASNTVDNILFDDYFGTQENVSGSVWLRRDNSREPEQPHIQEKREKVAQYMYDMATTEWHVKEPLVHSCTCQLSICHGTFTPDYTYYGPPYNHKASSLFRMQYCIDEDGYLKDFVTTAGALDGYDMYIGSDCSAATAQAFYTVGTEVCFTQTQDESPVYGKGTYPVGDYVYDLGLDKTSQAMITKKYTDHNGEETMFEAYAQVRIGDAVVYWFDGYGHSRICAADAVVVRDENGKINGQYSYILMHEQGVLTQDDVKRTYTSWRTYWKYTFDNLFSGYYIPITIKEFITGEFAEVECALEGGLTNSRLGLTTGTVVSNYALDYVTVKITDEAGNTVFDHTMFPSVSKSLVDGGTHSRTRAPNKAYDLISFAPALQEICLESGATYHATITATVMPGDSIVVSEFSFNG